MSLSSWPVVEKTQAATALANVRAVVGDIDATAARLRDYYDPVGDFAGDTFLTAMPNDINWVTPADLYAVSMLDIKISAAATRRLLDDPSHQAGIHQALRATPDVDLAVATAEALCAARQLYRAIHAAVRSPHAKKSDPWVTASKLAARKRPRLVPVRDSLVRGLGLMTVLTGYSLSFRGW